MKLIFRPNNSQTFHHDLLCPCRSAQLLQLEVDDQSAQPRRQQQDHRKCSDTGAQTLDLFVFRRANGDQMGHAQFCFMSSPMDGHIPPINSNN
jgi:hypothetical protein